MKRKKRETMTAASLGFEESDWTMRILANKACPFKNIIPNIIGIEAA